MHEQPSA